MDEAIKGLLIGFLLFLFIVFGAIYLDRGQQIECIKIVKDKTSAEIQTICK